MTNQILSFLNKVEDPEELEMNTRSVLSGTAIDKILEDYPQIPGDYLVYL